MGSTHLNTFELLLLRNSSQLEQADKILSYLTTFLPGQTPSMELASEAIVSCSSLLQVCKSQALYKITRESSKSLESKFLEATFEAHKEYRMLAYGLSLAKSTELLIEMASTKFRGQKGRWNAIIGLETLKSALRLRMLMISKRALPSTIPLHEGEAEQAEISQLLLEHGSESLPQSKFKQEIALSSPSQSRTALLKPIDRDILKPPIQLVRKLNKELALSEAIVILRPLIYAILLYRSRNSRHRSWTPWIVGVALELTARKLTQITLKKMPRNRVSALEKDIYKARDSSLGWWLMRGKLYDEYTRDFLMGIVSRLTNVPILSLGGRLLEDFLYLFDEYYFASATL